jgi:hypothetical protein
MHSSQNVRKNFGARGSLLTARTVDFGFVSATAVVSVVQKIFSESGSGLADRKTRSACKVRFR